jgi:hypothetical protein
MILILFTLQLCLIRLSSISRNSFLVSSFSSLVLSVLLSYLLSSIVISVYATSLTDKADGAMSLSTFPDSRRTTGIFNMPAFCMHSKSISRASDATHLQPTINTRRKKLIPTI